MILEIVQTYNFDHMIQENSSNFIAIEKVGNTLQSIQAALLSYYAKLKGNI